MEIQDELVCGECMQQIQRNQICYNCKGCKLHLCNVCKRHHLRNLATRDHEIKTIRFYHNFETMYGDYLKKVCQRDHPTTACSVFCETCEELICTKCMKKYHRNHIHADPEDTCRQLRSELGALNREMEAEQKKIKMKEISLNKFQNIHEKNYHEERKKIQLREQFLHDMVSKMVQRLQVDLDINWNFVQNDILRQKNILEQTLKDISHHIQTIKDSTVLGDIELMSRQNREIRTKISSIDEIEIDYINQSCHFVEGMFNEKKLSEMFGRLQETFIPEPDKELSIKMIQCHRIDVPDIRKIIKGCHDNKGQYFMISHKKLIKADLSYNDMTIEDKNLQLEVEDIAKLKSENLLLTFANCTKVFMWNIWKDECEPNVFVDLKTMKPLAIHVTDDNCILTGCISLHPDTTYKHNNRNKLLKFDEDGKEIVLKKLNRGTNDLLDFPFRIVTNYDNICIVNQSTTKIKGHIVMLDKDGKLKWTYDGRTNSTGKQFLPSDIAITLLRNIVISDIRNNFLHVVSCEGVLMTCINLQDHKITFPMSICVTHNGRLLLASSEKNTKSNIYIIRFHNFN